MRFLSRSLAAPVLVACTLASSLASSLAAQAPKVTPPSPDPRVGLKAGLYDAADAAWNMRLLSATRPSEKFLNGINSDLAFMGPYAIQGSYNGFQVWDISNPSRPTLATAFYCPASQSDVSVYRNLLFVSSESNSGRLDCGAQGVADTVSHERIRGIRIFDITDIKSPKQVADVQTCRGSHTHSVLVDPKDAANVYVYISGSSRPRSPNEMPGCVDAGDNPNDPASARFRIEVIKVPLAHPEQAAIVSSPRIFNDLTEPPSHGLAPDDISEIANAKARGQYVVNVGGQEFVASSRMIDPMLDSIVKARGGSGAPTRADSTALRGALNGIVAKMFGVSDAPKSGPRPGPTQCHDITLFPAIGLAGGACEGYGMLLDISDPAHPRRVAAVADSNFSYWHSATFNNDGTKVLFSDEWGGGGSPKCRATDPKEWGADAIFQIQNGRPVFQSYYKLPAAQTAQENCVAHNGSLIPIPGRDVMVQAWYQGGLSVFDFTDAKHPTEIAFYDRGPVDAARMAMGGSWSVYWYNGAVVSSEIARGIDVLELLPSAALSQNELDAAKSVHLDYLNAQGQPKFVWPPSFALARAYVDQLERDGGLAAARVTSVRQALASAEGASGAQRTAALLRLASQVEGFGSAAKVRTLAGAVRDLAGASR